MAAEASCAVEGWQSAEVAALVDAGTIRLKDGRVARLSGIETPGVAAEAVAAAARLRVGELLGNGPVTLAAVGNPDRHNRIHAWVFLADGRSLQSVLVGEGLARVRFMPGEELCGEDLLPSEKNAREARKGLWNSHEYAIRSADDPSLLEQIGLYGLIEGRVVSVDVGSRIVFLDFGRNWRRDFTVMVAASAADRFTAAGKKLESLAKRRVRVRGVLEESNGPAIRLDDPAAIEILDDGVK